MVGNQTYFQKDLLKVSKNKNQCFKYILKKIEKGYGNKALFQTSICLTLKDNHHIVFEGKVKGTISKKIIGKSGFGYDPIFIPEGFSKTLVN